MKTVQYFFHFSNIRYVIILNVLLPTTYALQEILMSSHLVENTDKQMTNIIFLTKMLRGSQVCISYIDIVHEIFKYHLPAVMELSQAARCNG